MVNNLLGACVLLAVDETNEIDESLD